MPPRLPIRIQSRLSPDQSEQSANASQKARTIARASVSSSRWAGSQYVARPPPLRRRVPGNEVVGPGGLGEEDTPVLDVHAHARIAQRLLAGVGMHHIVHLQDV